MASENEVKIYVTTDVDLTDAEGLQSLLDDIQAKAEETKDSLSDVGGDIDTTGADELADSLDEDKSNAEDLSSTLGGLDSTGLQEANSNAQELAGSLSDSAAGASELETAMGGLAGVAAAAGVMEMVDTAGRINDSWNQLGLTFGTVTDDMKADMDSAAAATGRSGGTIRDYFNQMGIAGVKNTDLLTQSFESLSGRAYQTGNSIETMENSMKRMVMSGNAGARQLTQLGITTEDLGRAMGVSADEASKAFSALSQEDRLRVLTQAMGDGKQANEEYKNSWQGVKDQASAAFAGLMGAVGTPILQMLIPIMQGATKVVKFLSDAFKHLPGPLQAVIGGIGAGAAIFAAFAGAIGVAGQIISGLSSGIRVIRELSIVSKALGAVRTVLTTINEALAISEWAALGPILLVVVAIVALVAILWYLYNTCEPVHDAIDAIWEGLSGAIQPIIDSVQWLIDKLTQLVNGDWSVTINIAKAGASAGIGGVLDLANNDLSRGLVSSLLGDDALAQVDESMPAFKEKLTTSMNELLDAIWNDGTQGFLGWLANISGIDVNSYFSGLQNSLAAIPNWVDQAGTAAVQGFQSMYFGAVSWLNSTISNVMSFGSRLVSNMSNAARNAVSQFTSGIRKLGQGLRDELNGMLSDAANFVGQIGRVMWNAAVNAWSNFLAGLQRHSPGIMMREFKAEMLGIVSTAEDTRDPLGDTMYSLANTAVKSWGNPNFGFEFEDLESQKFDSNGMSNLETLMNKIIELLRNQAPTGNTYQFTLNGDIDSEERMQKFIDAVRRDIEWDNEKAGRTV